MSNPQWASLQSSGAEDAKIRRGAWYRVLRLGPVEIVLEVNRKPLSVPRVTLRLAPAVPQAWSVVHRPKRAPRLPPSWGDEYIVCPSCRERAPLSADRPTHQRCHKCNGYFPIAWPSDARQSA